MKRGIAALILLVVCGPTAAKTQDGTTSGRLTILTPQGEPRGLCPLEHTEVEAEITGFVTRVHVTQKFHNPYKHKIEAIYTFPLRANAAVDDMTMTVGDRVIRGRIKERAEARRIYEAAKAAGHVASLLDQERPNIFTQHIANIEPGEVVQIKISYTDLLEWKEGLYSFVFPMVVGPRYIPGAPPGAHTPAGHVPPTPQVPDAPKITPPVTPEGTRAGHDISVAVRINAGKPIQHLDSKQHAVDVEYLDAGKTTARVKLKNEKTIPNKDFVLNFSTATDTIADAVLTHTDERGKFLTLILQPPKRVRPEIIRPKEMIFVIDKSGSMSGFPIETAKAAMRLCINNLNPKDTFNLMTFAGGVGFCFDGPVPNTPANRTAALNYLGSLRGSGGTEMMRAIHACLDRPEDPERVRIVCFMTDGYVGNDMAIIDAVRKNAGVSRVFSLGIGRSVNRYLIEQMAIAGRGQADIILSQSDSAQAAERFYQRVTVPVLTDIQLDFGDLPIEQVFPKRIPDLFGTGPIVVTARYTKPARGKLTIRGKTGAGDFTRTVDLPLPENAPDNEVLAPLWARANVRHLMSRDLTAVQQGRPNPEIKRSIIDLGLTYRLLTQYTSFVAVEELRITEGGVAQTVHVPVEMPEGVSYEGVFGPQRREARMSGKVLYAGAAGRGMRQRGAIDRLSRVKSLGYAADAWGARKMTLEAAKPKRFPATPPPVALGEAADLNRIVNARQPEHQQPDQKLDAALRDLAKRVGADGNFAEGRIKVTDWKIRVAVQLKQINDEVRKKLEALGFKTLAEARSTRLFIGRIDVRKLDELAKLDLVIRVSVPQT